MTDLSSLFTSLPSRTRTEINFFNLPQSTVINGQGREKSQSWRLSDLQSSLKKSIKTKLNSTQLTQQMNDFDKVQKGQFLNKVFSCIGLTLILAMTLQIQAKISFHLLILLFAELVLRTPLKIVQEPIISKSIRAVKPILYTALAYYLLKWIAGVPMDKLNYPLTYASILMGTVYAVLEYLDPVFSIQTKQIMLKIVASSKITKKVAFLPVLLLSRFTFIKKMHKYLLVVFCIMSALLLFLFNFCLSISLMTWFKPTNFVLSLGVFVFLEVLLTTVRLILCGWIGRLDIVRDKMPIFLTLLRLSGSSLNQKIQQICLQNLYIKMSKIPCFLSTQTCKSILFPTYMDLFNIYATSELEKLHADITKELSKIDRLQSVVNSRKTLLDDLFIWIKKVAAFLQQIDRTVEVFDGLQRKETLMRVILLSDEQASKEKDNIKVSPRVSELMDMINEKVKKIKVKTIKGGIKQELQGFENRLSGWLASMREGWI